MANLRAIVAPGLAAVVLASASPSAVAGATPPVLGADAAACRTGPAAMVRVHGFKDYVGEVRVQLYSDVPDDFLASGKKLRRVVVGVVPGTAMDICVALPSTGRFALAVLHDRDSNHKLSIWRDGVGFSNNPRIGLGKPDLKEVLFEAKPGVSTIDVVLNYRSGLAVRPLAGL